MQNSKCKICRRLGVKLFLKGEKCLSPKCPMVRKPYPPGQKGKRRPTPLSEYGKELREKQKLKNWYNLKEAQFRKYVKEVLEAIRSSKRGKVRDPAASLIKTLESRLDNVIFRLGIASSRAQARQLISHGHFLVNDKIVNIPSYLVKKGDKITPSPHSLKKTFFQNLPSLLKKQKIPSWLELNIEKVEGKVKEEPNLEEAAPPAEILAIFEYYSR
ncbi:MAG: 30S ribosomal protein S4 [Patescibacteria group bacterium]|nr:30S ribosomal protein S4 [Patescibacteria group bacterium]